MITVIDYGINNLASVGNALLKIHCPFLVSGDFDTIKKSDALILPGIGAAGYGMKSLREKGLDSVIIEQVNKGRPILGICLGMQLLFTNSEEGNVRCLSLVDGSVKRFKTKLKVPEIGWNTVRIENSEENSKNIFYKVPDDSYFYFVNSYYCDPVDQTAIAGVTDYDGEFCSVLVQDNIFGAQFHPEKSGDVGLQFLKNFCNINNLSF